MFSEAEILADLLVAYDVKDVFVSPGSRNAPLLEAMADRKELRLRVTSPDERVAAFVAMGYGASAMCPVALVCTSGSAVLNYAPAVVEAYYRRVPMIVISADRPLAMIDQDDSQTIRQPGVLDNIVKHSFDIGPVSMDRRENEWMADRLINDAITTALQAPQGPVHLNIHIGNENSVADMTYEGTKSRSYCRNNVKIETIVSRPDMDVAAARRLAVRLGQERKVLVVCAVDNPDGRLNRALGRLSAVGNVAIVAESVANVHGRNIICNPDAALAACPDSEWLERLMPDVVITLGGAVVSARLKKLLRCTDGIEHWQVGRRDHIVDCFYHLALRVDMDSGYFMQQLAAAMQPMVRDNSSAYSQDWAIASRRASSKLSAIVARCGWCDLKAMSVILHMIPKRWNVELSNGTTVRYACELGLNDIHRCGCNRGVSGIDGSTSTAIGVSMAYGSAPTLLITGDMSALYDMGALGIVDIPDRMKIVVIDNGGGGIFRSIPATRSLTVAHDLLAMERMILPARELASAFGFEYFEVYDERGLRDIWHNFADSSRKAMMKVVTSAEESARIYAQLFDNNLFEVNNIKTYKNENLDYH